MVIRRIDMWVNPGGPAAQEILDLLGETLAPPVRRRRLRLMPPELRARKRDQRKKRAALTLRFRRLRKIRRNRIRRNIAS